MLLYGAVEYNFIEKVNMVNKPIPVIDLHAQYAALKPELDAAVARVLDSGWYILGKEVAAFTNSEEEKVGLTEVVPFLLETKLKERGAKPIVAPDFERNVVASGRLVTGQNPASATGVAEKMLEILRKN